LDIVDTSRERGEEAPQTDEAKVVQKMRDLESKYNIKFETPQTSDYGERVRNPTLAEIEAVEDAFSRSPTSVREAGRFAGKPLLITFIKDRKDTEPPAQHQGAIPRVVVFDKYSKQDLQWVMLHELAHNEDKILQRADFTKLGWKQAIDPLGNKKDQWLFEAKDGTLYRSDERKEGIFWVRTDAFGNDLNPSGEGGTLTNDQMYDRAKLKPATKYFYMKEEVFADAMAQYKSSEKTNLELYRNNPELYKYLRDYDQARLDDRFGVGWWTTTPTVYRDIDGEIKPIPKDGKIRRAEDIPVPEAGMQGTLEGVAGGIAMRYAEEAAKAARHAKVPDSKPKPRK
jgi:hypothetical protein